MFFLGGMKLLSDYEKLFILCIKGHFSSYEQPEKVIIGKALMSPPELISSQNLENYAIRLFEKLVHLGMIEGATENPFKWMIEEMLQSVNLLNKPTLYEWLRGKIQYANLSEEKFSEFEIKRLTKQMHNISLH